MDYFMKAADEAELFSKLQEAEVLVSADDPDNPSSMRLNGFALDVIGTISKPTGKTNTVDGMEVPEMAPIPGYHANLRGVLSDTQLAILEPILLPEAPANPFRVWG